VGAIDARAYAAKRQMLREVGDAVDRLHEGLR
jgi:hypothetical protein